uniref:Syntrophin gamma 2 n=1 Tax=Lates calcarifer TaxID=8187 RepID=A0A4W6G0D1_LATCA
FHLVFTKSGIALLYNEETNNTYDVCLKLTKEVLTIQKLDVVCTSGSESQVNHRTVVLRRQATGGLGLSIKGGAEHNVPVVISKIFKDQVGKKVFYFTTVHLLRTAGDEVTITVRYLREVPSFLKLPLGSPGPSTDHSRVSSPLFDSGLHLNGNGNNTAPSPPSPSANEPKYEKRWLDAVSLPLLMARVSRYKAGTDKLRSNCFEVFALDGASTNILQFCTAAESTDWLQAISTNISDLMQENVSPSLNIVHMGWACESPEGSTADRSAVFKFLALRGPYFYIFRSPPGNYSFEMVLYNIYIYRTGPHNIHSKQVQMINQSPGFSSGQEFVQGFRFFEFSLNLRNMMNFCCCSLIFHCPSLCCMFSFVAASVKYCMIQL